MAARRAWVCWGPLGRGLLYATFWVWSVSVSSFPPDRTQLLTKVRENSSKGHLATGRAPCTHWVGPAAGGARGWRGLP